MLNATLCWLSVKATFINAKKAIFNQDHVLPFHSNPNIGQGCRAFMIYKFIQLYMMLTFHLTVVNVSGFFSSFITLQKNAYCLKRATFIRTEDNFKNIIQNFPFLYMN